MTYESAPGVPWSPEAEQGAIGAMMLSKDAICEVMEVASPRDFYDPKHESIYQAIVAMYAAGTPVDAITLADELARRGELARIGMPYLHTCMSSVPTAANGGYYAVFVSKLAVKRRMIEAGTRIRQMGLDTDLDDIDVMLDTANQELVRAAPLVGQEPDGIVETLEAVLEGMANPGDSLVYRSGLRSLDDLYRGAAAGRLDVLAARPGVGKSVLANAFVRANAIHRQVPTLFFSLEMSAQEIMQRLLAAEARVNLHRITDPLLYPLEDGDWTRLAPVAGRLSSAPLIIHDKPVGLLDIQRETRKAVRRSGVKLVIVDYLQLMLQPRNAESRQVGVGANADGLKMLGKELDVAVVALSQLNRNPDKRGNGVPRLSDLRESGSIEQSADCVILIHRPDVEEPESPRAGEADLIVAKQRNGRTGIATVVFQGHYARFSDFAPEPSR